MSRAAVPVGSYSAGGWVDPDTGQLTRFRPPRLTVVKQLEQQEQRRAEIAAEHQAARRLAALERAGDILETLLPIVSVGISLLMLWAVIA